jgi:TonB-dependent starch-binding outer membrane protein SusC
MDLTNLPLVKGMAKGLGILPGQHGHLTTKLLKIASAVRSPLVRSAGAKRICRVMKLTSFLILCAALHVAAAGHSQKVSLSVKEVSLKTVFVELNKQTGYNFLYSDEILARARKVSINVHDATLDEVLELSFRNQPLEFSVSNNTIVVRSKGNGDPQFTVNTSAIPPPIDISGRVTDVDGNPLARATVKVKGTNNVTTTNDNGVFLLQGVDKNAALEISFVGYQSLTVAINNRSSVVVALKLNVENLGEVIINKGYYSEKQRLSTGSVSKVNSSEIEKQPVTNIMAALIGRVPGLEITQAGGIPGAGFKVRIRGQNSIAAGNNPLFIVDGVPFSSESLGHNYVGQQLPYIDGNIAISPFNILNPSDIASIEVLKDADATAIYGSRGANGVILITTKRGKAGDTKYEINMSTGLSKVARFVEMVGTDEYLAIRKKAFANDGVTSYPPDAYDLNGTWDQTRYTNWQKELIGGTAKNWNVQAGVSGGSEFTQFLVRGSAQKETTVYPGDFHYDRGSVLVNVNHRSADGKFKLNLSANYATDNNNMVNTDLTRLALWYAPVAPALHNPDGSLNWADGTWDNPLADLNGSYDGKNRNLNTNMIMDIRIMGDLYFKTSMGFSDYRLNEYMTKPSTIYNPIYQVGSEYSYVWSNTGNRQNWIIEPQLNWKKQLGKGTFQALVGASFQHQSSNRSGIYADNFPSNSLIYDLGSASYQWAFLNDNTLYKYQAVFGRLNYNLSDKYIINLTARRDGSSRFSPEHQFANFGAVGANWIFSNEKYIQQAFPFLSFGKLRGSYGITGNDQIGDYQFLNTYNTTNGLNYQGIVGLLPQRLYNPDFGWESNKKLEAAIELGFFNDRLVMIAEWYKNRSSSQLVGIPLSAITGFTSFQSNLPAVVQNTGLEFEVQGSIINNNKFTWRSSANISIPRNKLVSYPGLEESSYANTYVVGQPLTIAKKYHMLGIDPVTGIYQYEDVNKDGQLSTAYDRTTVRNIASHYYGGINNSFKYGNVQLDIFIQFVKTTGYNYLYWISPPGNYPGSIMKDVAKNIWEPGKTNATIQVLTAGANQAALNAWDMLYRSDAAVSDYYFARLKNVSLSYQLPQSLLKKLQGRIYVQSQNLFTLTNYVGADPEVGSMQNLGPLKTITFGVQLNF